jgi:hypothetical protein
MEWTRYHQKLIPNNERIYSMLSLSNTRRPVLRHSVLVLVLAYLSGCANSQGNKPVENPVNRASAQTQPASSRPASIASRSILDDLFTWIMGPDEFPPNVETAQDIEQLPASATSVSTGGLPDSEIPSLARLRQLDRIRFGGADGGRAKITDEGLIRLSRLDLPQLHTLDLCYCGNITDAGLAYVGNMHTLTDILLMGNPQITDAGLQKLLTMKGLTWLDLRGCSGITSRSLLRMADNTNWQVIMLTVSQNVTSEDIARLQAALPSAQIINVVVGSANYPAPPFSNK